jgi:hypothetical protein
VAVVQRGGETDDTVRRFYRGGVVGFPGVARAVRGLERLVERAGVARALAETPADGGQP